VLFCCIERGSLDARSVGEWPERQLWFERSEQGEVGFLEARSLLSRGSRGERTSL